MGRVPTLKDLCLREVAHNLDGLSVLGAVPFTLISSAFTHVTAAKLTELETVNQWPPDLCLDLWHQLVTRDFRNSQTPTDSTLSWRDLYRELEKEKKDKLDRVKAKLAGVYKRAEDRKEIVRTQPLTNLPATKRGKHSDGGVKKGKPPALFAKALKQAKQATR